METIFSKVEFLDKSLHQEVRRDADKKFDKNSYTKNLWVLREYKKRGGKVKYSGEKPSQESIKKQVKGSILTFEVDITSCLIEKAIQTEIATASEEDKEDLETLLYSFDEPEFLADFVSESAEKKKNVKLNKPFRTPGGPKKFSVYVKNDKGNIVKVNFGDPNMEIKRDDPDRRKNFRARHNCDNPGPKWKAKYWSCKFWSSKKVSSMASIMEEKDFKDSFESFTEENE